MSKLAIAALAGIVAAGCATHSAYIQNYDGSYAQIKDAVPIFMKRDLSTANASLQTSKDEKWTVGAQEKGTDGTAAIELLGIVFQGGFDLLGKYLTGQIAPAPATSATGASAPTPTASEAASTAEKLQALTLKIQGLATMLQTLMGTP